MPTSVKEFFESKVPGALLKHPDKAKDVAAVYLFKINGPDGGVWTADLNASPPTCTPGESAAPQCTIEASDDDFRAMIDGGMPVAMQLFFGGKIKVTGDANLAPRLSKILQMGAS